MKAIYIIGGMGAGKSSVTRILSSQGLPVVDLDDLGHEVLTWDSVKDALANAFGEDICTENGIDRALLAARAFESDEHTRLLNGIVQTAIRRLASDRLHEFSLQGYKASVIECSAFRSREEEMLGDDDTVVAVIADYKTRIERAMHSGWSLEDVEMRIAQQISDEQRCAMADYVIENNGSPEELEKNVIRMLNVIQVG